VQVPTLNGNNQIQTKVRFEILITYLKCRCYNVLYIHLQFVEEEFRLRTKQRHIEQCGYIDRPGISNSERVHYSKVYGINRTSILFDLPDFDLTQQLPQDLMRVLLEGIFPVHMEQLLYYVVQILSVWPWLISIAAYGV